MPYDSRLAVRRSRTRVPGMLTMTATSTGTNQQADWADRSLTLRTLRVGVAPQGVQEKQ